MLFRRLPRLLERAGGVFVRLARKLMCRQASFAMRSRGCGVGVGGKIVVFGGSIVNALGH
jgi:hypothetical protein